MQRCGRAPPSGAWPPPAAGPAPLTCLKYHAGMLLGRDQTLMNMAQYHKDAVPSLPSQSFAAHLSIVHGTHEYSLGDNISPMLALILAAWCTGTRSSCSAMCGPVTCIRSQHCMRSKEPVCAALARSQHVGASAGHTATTPVTRRTSQASVVPSLKCSAKHTDSLGRAAHARPCIWQSCYIDLRCTIRRMQHTRQPHDPFSACAGQASLSIVAPHLHGQRVQRAQLLRAPLPGLRVGGVAALPLASGLLFWLIPGLPPLGAAVLFRAVHTCQYGAT